MAYSSGPEQFGKLNVWAIIKHLFEHGVGPFITESAPVSGTSGTLFGKAGPGALLIDITNKRIHINTNTKASPTWSILSNTGASSFFLSAEQTGNGAAQNVAHGLGVIPSKVIVYPTDTAPAVSGVYTMTEGAHDATNAIVTVTTGKKYKVAAWA